MSLPFFLLVSVVMFTSGAVHADPLPLAGGGAHTLFLSGNGDLYLFGLNNDGQLGLGGNINRTSPVLAMSGVVMATAGIKHSLIYTREGKLYAAGNNQYGQLGTGTVESSNTFVEIAQGDVAALEEGGGHSLAILTASRSLFSWGWNASGQLCMSTDGQNVSTPAYTGIDGVRAVAGGDHHTLILKTDGSVWACGDNTYGQLGNPNYSSTSTPVSVLGVTGAIVDVKAGGEHSVLLTDSGSIYVFGKGINGQLCTGRFESANLPIRLYFHSPVLKVDAEGPLTLLLFADGAYSSGFDLHGEAGNSLPLENIAYPELVLAGATAIGAGHYHSHAIRDDVVFSWGMNDYGQAGAGNDVDSRLPEPVPAFSTKNTKKSELKS
jgi:alpha-tubulin suppressor-like RCC1 family protein